MPLGKGYQDPDYQPEEKHIDDTMSLDAITMKVKSKPHPNKPSKQKGLSHSENVPGTLHTPPVTKQGL